MAPPAANSKSILATANPADTGFVNKKAPPAMSDRYVIPPPPQAALAVKGSDKFFPVRRIWCVGRNYIEHIREMGQDERAPPFFFAKPADAIVPDGSVVPYPPLTKDMHHEVELVVALKSGGLNIKPEKANDCIWGYGVGIDLTRRQTAEPAGKTGRDPCARLYDSDLPRGDAASHSAWRAVRWQARWL